jgi:hypothetical protein
LVIRHDAGETAEPYVEGTLLAVRKVPELVGLTRGLDNLLLAATTSVETTKLGSRTEWICVPSIVTPRASRDPWRSSIGTRGLGLRTSPSRSASSRAVPLGTSGFPALA